MSGSYKVGYGKPPRHSQFKPGQSGNARSVRKAPPKLAATILREVRRRYPAIIDGKKQKLEALTLIVRGLVNQAMKQNLPASRMVLDYYAVALIDEMTASDTTRRSLTENELGLLREFLGEGGEAGSDAPERSRESPRRDDPPAASVKPPPPPHKSEKKHEKKGGPR